MTFRKLIFDLAFGLAWLSIWFCARAHANDPPSDGLIRDNQIDVLEDNTYSARWSSGRAWIFWGEDGEVKDWIRYGDEEPQWDGKGKRWVLFIERANKTYLVRARVHIETRTYFDREQREHAMRPNVRRAGLGNYCVPNPFVPVPED